MTAICSSCADSLAQLIDEALLDQYADKLGLNISDEQVKQAIFAVPAFQTDNRFDNEKYLAQVRRLGLTPDAYAQLLRKQLTSQQLIRGFGNTEFLLPQEIDNLVKLAAQDRVVRLATIDISARAGAQNVSDDEVRSYYEQNQARFLAPEAFKVSYITLDAAAIMDKVTVTDADIDDFYEKIKMITLSPSAKIQRYSGENRSRCAVGAGCPETGRGFCRAGAGKVDGCHLAPQWR